MKSALGWEVILPVQESGTACHLTLPLGGGQIRDVLFGDVWFCSGQSNMEWRIKSVRNAAAEITTATAYEDIRLLKVGIFRRKSEMIFD